MSLNRHMARLKFGFLALIVFAGTTAFAQVSFNASTVLKHSVDESKRTRLKGNIRPEVNANSDMGAVASGTRFDHILLQLRRPPEQQQALDTFLMELRDPTSPNFHKWLSAQEFGTRFGLAPEDLATVTEWLESHGLQVNGITPNLAVDFSGTAAQVYAAFHTRIHNVRVHGETHLANMTDPEIPAALVPAVAGVVSLNDFRPDPLNRLASAVAEFTTASGHGVVAPPDLSVIYNFKPAFTAGVSGQGQTIAVLENSDMYNTGDWYIFRKVFGLARPYPQGRLVVQHPASANGQACIAPGVNINSAEATLDAEWASAAAPNATIVVASCNDTFIAGPLVALQNLLTNGSTPPAVVSISYGMSEAMLGEAQNAFVNSLYQMAVAEGVSVFVGSGDTGGAGSDQTSSPAYRDIAVNGFASTPYNVAVGATDFADGYFGTTSNYWSNVNSPIFGSALSYVPEITWNGSCGSELLAQSNGFVTTYGSGGFCNNGGPVSATAGGGGPSGCASGVPNPGGVVGNTCAGYAKPTWQRVSGNPSDGVRDLPDVALFASTLVWGHTSIVCYSGVAFGGSPCLGDPSTWNGFGGTSLSTPIMAGIQALVNQKTGSRWGNPNPIYYALAASDYAGTCDATGPLSDSCTFHDVTLGDTAVPCILGSNCYFGPSPGANGVLSVSSSAYQPAFKAGPGWDFATGLGSVNVWNLLNNWSNAAGGI